MKNIFKTRLVVLFFFLTSFSLYAQHKGIHDVTYNPCNGTLKIRFLISQFSSCGICGASLDRWWHFSNSGNYIMINGVNAVEVGRDMSSSESYVRYGPCGKRRTLYMRGQNGYYFRNLNHNSTVGERGGGCIRCSSNCLAWYAEVEITLREEDYGQSLNISMSGNYNGDFSNSWSTVHTAPNFPQPHGLTTEPVCGGVELEWTRPDQQCNQTTIQIYRDGQYLTEVSSTDDSYTDNVPYVAGGYKYEIRSKVSLPGRNYYSNFLESTNPPVKVLSSLDDFEVGQLSCATNEADISSLLTWKINPLEEPETFIIERSLSPDFTADFKQHQIAASVVQEYGTSNFKFNDDNTVWGELRFDTKYYYRVRGIDRCGVEKMTGVKSIEVPGSPLKPENLLGVLVDQNTIDLSWDHSGGKHNAFNIYRKGQSSSFSLIATVDSMDRAFRDNSVVNCSEYQYVVAAKSKCFNEQRSEEIIFPIALNPNLNEFARFSATKGFHTDRVALSWEYTGVSSVSKFIIYKRSLEFTNAFQEVARIDAPAENWTDNDVESGRLYEYAVIALDCDLYKNFRPDFATVLKATGFSSEFGLINGKVTFEGGNGVKNVRITALPENNIAQGNSLDLAEGNMEVNLKDKEGNTWFPQDDWTLGFWVNPLDTVAGQTIFSMGDNNDINMSVGYQGERVRLVTEEEEQVNKILDKLSLYALSETTGTNVFTDPSDNKIVGQVYLPNQTFIKYEQGSALGVVSSDTIYRAGNLNPFWFIKSNGGSTDSVYGFSKETVTGPVPQNVYGFLSGNTIYESDMYQIPKLMIDMGDVYEVNVDHVEYKKESAYATMKGDTIRYYQDPSIYGIIRGDTIYNSIGKPFHILINRNLYRLNALTDSSYERADRFARINDTQDTIHYISSATAVGVSRGSQIGVINSNNAYIVFTQNPGQVSLMISQTGAVFYAQEEDYEITTLGTLEYLKKGKWLFAATDTAKLAGYISQNDVFYRVDEEDVYSYDPVNTVALNPRTGAKFIIEESSYGDLEMFSTKERVETELVSSVIDTLYEPLSRIALNLPGNQSISLDEIVLNKFNHIFVTYKNSEVRVFVDGILKDSLQVDLSTVSYTKATFGPFKGLLDEVSMWSQAKTQEQAYKDYQRYLGSNEDHLIGYWRINEGVGGNAYDASNKETTAGIVFNEHHATLTGNAKWSTEVPVSEQLSYTSYTDENGNYTIEAVAFSGAGQNYKVTPIFNKHEFSPSNKILFIGKGALIQNNVDFLDLSSFRVTGLVQYDPLLLGYEDRDDPNIVACGVQDAYFLIDGEPLFKDGNLLKTDRNGYFEIDVPIGKHTIRVQKNNHTFSVGQWPPENPHNFQDDVIGLKFYDSTTVKMIGKVTGGVTEGNKFPGFGKTVNNIGTAKITFQSIGKDCVTKTITTDSLTGEYEVELLPLLYRVAELKLVNATAQENRKLRKLTEGTIEINTDSLTLTKEYESDYFEDGALDKFVEYHLVKNFIYREPSEVIIKSDNDDPEFFGDQLITVQLPENNQRATINLKNNPVHYPVFRQDQPYMFRVKVAEQYINADNGAVYDDDVSEGDFRVENNIAGDLRVIKLEDQERDSLGYFEYIFFAGNPNITYNRIQPEKSYTKDIQFFGPGNTPWLYKGDIFRGYVLGSIAESQSDFYTVKRDQDDPLQMVDFVLRDPPGSQSYAFIEKGTKLEFASKYETTNSNEFSEEIGVGIGFEKLLFLTLVAKEKSMVGMKYEQKWTDEKSITSVRSVETTRRIETSQDPRNAGHQSDLFVGRGINIFTPVTRNVAFIPEDQCKGGCLLETVYPNGSSTPFAIGKYRSIAVYINAAEETEFVYTAVQIEQEVKALQKAIKEITDTTTAEYNRLKNQINIWKQVLGHNELNKLNAIHSSAPRKNYSFGAGSVIEETYNLSNTNTSTENFNYKASGGGYLEVYFEMFATSKLRVDYNNVTTSSVSSSTQQTDQAKVGYVLQDDDVGDKLNIEVILAGKEGRDEDLENFDTWKDVLRTKMVMDFTIGNAVAPLRGALGGWSDPEEFDTLQINADDYFNKFMYDPVFVLKGGRTSCPHEEELEAKYVKYVDPTNTDTTKLSKGSYRRDRPGLRIEPRVLSGIPADQRAIFDVVFENYNDEDTTRIYQFILDQRTNTNGATLRLDGERFIKGTDLQMSAADQLGKKITVRPIRGEYDYVDMVAYFYPACQFDFGADLDFQKDIYASDTFSVHFIPACPVAQVISPSNNWVINKKADNVLTCEIQENNFFFDNHRKIKLQFKPAYGTDLEWIDIEVWTRDSIEQAENNWQPFPKGNNYIVYDWDVTPYDLTNGDYDVRWYFVCEDGTESQSALSSGSIDKQSPYPFGVPQPADGVLSPGDEIILKFNEAIEIGKINQDNIIVEGRLNGEDIRHNTSIAFSSSGNDEMLIEDLNLLNSPFTVELWINRTAAGAQQILSHGVGEETFFTLEIDAQGKLVFTVNNNSSLTSVYTIPVDEWTHVALAFDQHETKATLYINGQRAGLSTTFEEVYLGEGDMKVGGNVAGKTPFAGQIHDLRVWKKFKSEIDIASNFIKKLTGKEVSLFGYWPMDKGEGTKIEDKAQDRDATFNGTWALLPTSMSLQTNGSYLEYPGNVAFSDESDFTIAFWFKGQKPAQTSTLFSNGKGEASLANGAFGNTNSWAIKAMTTGQIRVFNNGIHFNATDSNFFDNKWHHFALVINRNGYTSAYVDGRLKKAEYGMKWSGFGGPAINLGARVYYDTLTNKHADEYFNGSFDELRIWGLARRQQQIERDKNKRLREDKTGLEVYLPFEDYDDLLRIVVPSSENIAQGSGLMANLNATAIVGESPTIKSEPYPTPVFYNFSANGDQILIDISVNDPSRIENTILDFTVSNIYDKNGNKMVSPVTWSAYIDLNQVVWDRREENLRKKVDDPLTFEAYIKNESGTIQEYVIHNLPDWLTATPIDGELSPKNVQKVQFSVHRDLPKGLYSEPIYLKANEGINEVLMLNLEVYKPLPDSIKVNPEEFTDSMRVVGRIIIEDQFTDDPNDLLLATVENEVRGQTELKYISQYDAYYANLTIYSNKLKDEAIQFKIWDADEGKMYDLPDVIYLGDTSKSINFLSGSMLGTYSNPVLFKTTNSFTHEFSITEGWSWISFYATSPDLNRSNSLFKNLKNTNGDVISNGFGQFDTYDARTESWYGTLAGFNLDEGDAGFRIGWGYKVFSKQPKKIEYSGEPVDPLSISTTVKPNLWTWVGFVGGTRMELKQALGSLSPVDGDIIKSQTQFAIYDPLLGWVGTLQYLVPHGGYMIKCANGGKLTFPRHSNYVPLKQGNISWNHVQGIEHYAPNQYSENMTIIARIVDSPVLDNTTSTLVAEAQDKVIGVTNKSSVGEVFFLTIGSENKNTMSFKLYDGEGNVYVIQEEFSFSPNATMGTLDAPVELHIGNKENAIHIIPNPFTDLIKVTFDQEKEEDVYAELLNAAGQNVFTYTNHLQGKELLLQLGHLDLPSGMYSLKLKFENKVITHKLLKL